MNLIRTYPVVAICAGPEDCPGHSQRLISLVSLVGVRAKQDTLLYSKGQVVGGLWFFNHGTPIHLTHLGSGTQSRCFQIRVRQTIEKGGVVIFQHRTLSHENGRITRVVKRAFPSTVFHPSDRNIIPGPQQIPIPFCGRNIMP